MNMTVRICIKRILTTTSSIISKGRNLKVFFFWVIAIVENRFTFVNVGLEIQLILAIQYRVQKAS
jgi:hypothetical protein